MTQPEQSTKVLHADPEHGGLRLIVIFILVLGLIMGFVLIQLLLSLLASETILIEFATVLSCSGAIVFALGAAWASEIYLKRIWHSGTMLLLGDAQLGYQSGKRRDGDEEEAGQEMVFDWSKTINLTRWYFELTGYARAGRERRVSEKWLCLACRVQQDDDSVIAYAYLPPDEATIWVDNQRIAEPFHKISLAHLYSEAGKKKRDAATRPTIPSSMLSGRDGRYWLAEQKRWKAGVELTKEDFATLLTYIEQKL